MIAGYAAHKKTFQKLKSAIRGKDFIQLIGGDQIVPHDQILEEMSQTDFCLLPYHNSKSTEGRIPTKLFECLVMEKPMIISPDPTWDLIIKRNNAGIINDFQKPEIFPLEKLREKYYGNNLSDEYRWDSNSNILIEEIQQLLS